MLIYTSVKVRLFRPKILVRDTEGIDSTYTSLEWDQKKLLKHLKIDRNYPMSSLFSYVVRSPRKAGGVFVNTQNILLNSRTDSRDILSLFVDALI